MELINGHGGASHVSGSDVGRLYSCMVGEADLTYPVAIWGEGAPYAKSANAIGLSGPMTALADGMHVNFDGTEEWAIRDGATGYNRNDLCCIHYSVDADTGVESVSLDVIEGTAVTGTAKDPTVPDGRREDGNSVQWVPLARVSLSGLTPTVTLLAERGRNIMELYEQLEGLGKSTGEQDEAIVSRVATLEEKVGSLRFYSGTVVFKVNSDHIDLTPSSFGVKRSASWGFLSVFNGDYAAGRHRLATPQMLNGGVAWRVEFVDGSTGKMTYINGYIRVNYLMVLK